MTPDELEKMSREELIAMAKDMQIKNRTKMTKDELIDHLKSMKVEYESEKHTLGEPSEYFHPAPFTIETETHETNNELKETTELPNSYNQTQIVIMVRDSYWIYAYWDFAPETKEELSSIYNGWERIPLTLRVYNLSKKKIGKPEPNYFDLSISGHDTHWYIHVGLPNQEFYVELGYYSNLGDFICLTRSNIIKTPRDSVSEIVDEKWLVIEEDFRRLYRLAGGGRMGESSVEIIESLIKRLEKEVGSGAVSSISSPAKLPQKERRFWLVLDTELIVYGATEPDANLTLQGKPIKLRPDGTFTVRMALPDGVQVIPVTAKSSDGVDSITITPTVTKETH